jgi:hypothetical protein
MGAALRLAPEPNCCFSVDAVNASSARSKIVAESPFGTACRNSAGARSNLAWVARRA